VRSRATQCRRRAQAAHVPIRTTTTVSTRPPTPPSRWSKASPTTAAALTRLPKASSRAVSSPSSRTLTGQLIPRPARTRLMPSMTKTTFTTIWTTTRPAFRVTLSATATTRPRVVHTRATRTPGQRRLPVLATTTRLPRFRRWSRLRLCLVDLTARRTRSWILVWRWA